MNATYRFIGRGPRPLGSLCGGVLGTLIGLRPTLAVGVLGFMLGAVLLLLSPLPRLRELPHAGEESPRGY